MDLSIKIKVETVPVPVRHLSLDPKPQFYGIPLLSHNSSHSHHLPHTNDAPFTYLSQHPVKYETNNNHESKYVPDKNREIHSIPGLIIAPTARNSPASCSSGQSSMSIVSSQFPVSPTSRSNSPPCRGSPSIKGTSFCNNSPPQSPKVITTNTITTSSTSPKPSSSTSSSPAKSLVTPTKLVEAHDKNVQEEPIVTIKSENPIPKNYSGSIVTAPISSSPLHLSSGPSTPVSIPNGLELKADSNFSRSLSPSNISTIARMIPTALTDAMVVHHPATSLPGRLALPTPNISHEALTNFMKEHHAHAHFPLHLGHFPTGLPIAMQFDTSIKQGQYNR